MYLLPTSLFQDLFKFGHLGPFPVPAGKQAGRRLNRLTTFLFCIGLC